jgi:hypothetical protein
MGQQPPAPSATAPDPEELARLRDLEQRLRKCCEEITKESSPDLSKLFQTSTALLSLLGIGLYGAVRFGQQIFYNELGLAPEEVGLSYASSLSRAAVIVAAVSSVFLLGVSINVIADSLSRGQELRIGGLVAQILAFLVTMAAWIPISIFVWGDIEYIGIGAVLSLLVAFTLPLFRGNLNLNTFARRPALAIMVISLVTVGGFVLSGTTAHLSATAVKEGKEISGRGAFGVLGLRAEHVKLTGDLPKNFTAPDSISYLGSAEGTIIVYEYDDKDAPLRIPADGVAISH